mmetsp:Transcript_52757/g.112909  ORF Transcript_52757/g.112909 Transcript_52757/m.112909 type:complete len:214 (+) Transcript_52757:90-731(+)
MAPLCEVLANDELELPKTEDAMAKPKGAKRSPAEELGAEEAPPAKKAKLAEPATDAQAQPPSAVWWGLRLPTRASLLRLIGRSGPAEEAPAPPPAERLAFSGCTERPELNGLYRCVGDKYSEDLGHKLPTYEKQAIGSVPAVFCYCWDDENDEESNGWYFSHEVADTEVLGHHSAKHARAPPSEGWCITQADGSMSTSAGRLAAPRGLMGRWW